MSVDIVRRVGGVMRNHATCVVLGCILAMLAGPHSLELGDALVRGALGGAAFWALGIALRRASPPINLADIVWKKRAPIPFHCLMLQTAGFFEGMIVGWTHYGFSGLVNGG